MPVDDGTEERNLAVQGIRIERAAVRAADDNSSLRRNRMGRPSVVISHASLESSIPRHERFHHGWNQRRGIDGFTAGLRMQHRVAIEVGLDIRRAGKGALGRPAYRTAGPAAVFSRTYSLHRPSLDKKRLIRPQRQNLVHHDVDLEPRLHPQRRLDAQVAACDFLANPPPSSRPA